MRRLFLLLFLLGFVGNTKGAFAISSEQILNFDSQIYINKQNIADITETIRYDFGTTQHHGIYRDIPIDYRDGQGNVYRLVAEHKGTVDEEGHGVKAESSTTNGNLRIRLGDPDKTISGVHTYKIHYILRPVVSQKDGRDFVNLDITGNGWTVPIQNVSAVLSFEAGVSLADVNCYTGSSGSIAQECLAQESFPPRYTAQNLTAGQGMTINGFLPNGYVANYLQPNAKRPLTKGEIAGIAIGVTAVVSTLLFFVVLIMRRIRERIRKKRQVIIPEYEPSKGLTPAEIGHLQDDVSNTTEITATLIDLAVRGYIKIEQSSPKKLFRKAQYTLHKLKEPTGLSSDEATLFNAVFQGTTDNKIEVNKLNKSTMATTVASINASTKKSLKQKGFYGSIKSEPNIIEKMLDAGNITDEGAKMWAKVEGFKLYLSVVEKDRLKFTDAPDKTPELFSKLLPFAVALGVEKEWAKQFEGIDIQKSANWYAGSYAGLTAVNLASDLGSSFAPVVSSNSSVSSSGGSSGGGFGGGGGGSW